LFAPSSKPVTLIFSSEVSGKIITNTAPWQTYTMLTEVEAVFRSLKSELGLRPIFHQQTDRISAHLFISVLAYHLIQIIRFRLKKIDIHNS